MERITDIIKVNSVEQVPTLETIRSIPRERKMKLVFEGSVRRKRELIGENLKDELIGFQVLIHSVKPEINISKLITDEQIADNQDFFEQCAKDYRQLGEVLVNKLVDSLELKLNEDYPLETFNVLKQDKRQIGKVDGWNYFVHGFHCGFENNETGQLIEVPLVFGQEFGDLDPYFFSNFIKSTPDYRPMPIEIYEDYEDGLRIIEKMISLGKFERVPSNVGGHSGVVVTDRKKVEIKSIEELDKLYVQQNKQIEKPKFNLWKFMRLKK